MRSDGRRGRSPGPSTPGRRGLWPAARADRRADLGAQPQCRRRLLIFIVAYNAQSTIVEVIGRIPAALGRLLDVELLLIDDCSQDGTVARCRDLRAAGGPRFKLNVLSNPINQGYGGNQKIGYHYAIREGFDYVALLHGDGQYAPECLPELLAPLLADQADAVFGSRMLVRGAALRGGMPLYKFFGNKLLTFVQNRLLRSHLSEFHSGYRLYSTAALRAIPFSLNSQGFPFDTEIIIQLLTAGMRIRELPIPTFYGDEICYVNGLGYALSILKQTLVARAQRLSLFYDDKYDCGPDPIERERERTHLMPAATGVVLEQIPPGARVLDLGAEDAELAGALRSCGSRVMRLPSRPPLPSAPRAPGCSSLDDPSFCPDLTEYDHVLLLDVVEHLLDPERTLARLFDTTRYMPALTIIVSSANAAFITTRLMLLLGELNYGKRGILDRTHRRLFTMRSLTRLLNQAGFDVIARRGLPAPVGLALGRTRLARILLAAQRAAIRLAPGLFAFELVLIARSRPSLEYLLAAAQENPKCAQLQG